jgi:hypothetical protein
MPCFTRTQSKKCRRAEDDERMQRASPSGEARVRREFLNDRPYAASYFASGAISNNTTAHPFQTLLSRTLLVYAATLA